MTDSSHVDSLLMFLDIKRKHWLVEVEQTALVSIRVYHFLHKVRFRGPLEPVQPDRDPSSISSASDDNASIAVTKRKYRKNQAELLFS